MLLVTLVYSKIFVLQVLNFCSTVGLLSDFFLFFLCDSTCSIFHYPFI